LGYVLLGAVGQTIRVVVGLKKKMDEDTTSGKKWEWFEAQQLLMSVAIAFMVGGIAGTLATMQSLGQDITREYMIQ